MFVAILATVVLTSSCGDDGTTTTDQPGADSSDDSSGNSEDAGSGSDDNSQDADDENTEGTDSNDSESGDGVGEGGGDDGGEPDDDDAAEITGNPDLDLEELPEDAADALDDIDDIVSIGECSSEVVGLAVEAPEGWLCRVLDQSVGGIDGFTVFTEGNQLNITLGTPSPFGGPCDLPGLCDDAQPIALSDSFSDTMIVDIAGLPMVFGSHNTVDAELTITHTQSFTDDDLGLISAVLDSAVPV